MQGARRQSDWRRAPWQGTDRAQDLGASVNDTELRVYFRNSFRQWSICEKLSKKGQIVKKLMYLLIIALRDI